MAITNEATRLIAGKEGVQGTPEWQRWHGGDAEYTSRFLSGSALPAYIGVCPAAFGPACLPAVKLAGWLAANTGNEPHPATVFTPSESNKAAMQKGHDKEPLGRDLLFVETGYSFAESKCYEFVANPGLRSSPDGETVMTTVTGHKESVICEIKNKLRPPAFGAAPDAHYYWQCIFNLYVTRAAACILGVMYTRDDEYLVGPRREADIRAADDWTAYRKREGLPETAMRMWTIYRNDAAVEAAIGLVDRCKLVIRTAHERKHPGLLDPRTLAQQFTDGMLASSRKTQEALRVDLSPEASMGLYTQGFDTGHFRRGGGMVALLGA